MDALVISSHPIILFISPCKCNTSLGRVPVSFPGDVLEAVWNRCWPPQEFQEWVADKHSVIRWDQSQWHMRKSSYWPGGVFILAEGGAPRPADVGLFGVGSPNAWLEVSSIACDMSSWTLVIMLMWLSVLGVHSIARWEGEDGVKVLWRTGALGIWSPSVTSERSTSRNEGSWVELPSASQPWRSGPHSKVWTSSKSPFSPFGYTTWSPIVRVWILLVGRDACMQSRCSINHGTKMTLFREGYMLGILIELHKNVGPIIT